jgi:2-polyprenyl-6-hydroxyphenyl methylase/3-demethylubiquinone-9 3-methyltransferase
MEEAGFSVVDKAGFVFNPIAWSWSISARDLSVNYAMACINPE